LPPVAERPAEANAGRLLRAAGRESFRADAVLASGFALLALPVRLAHEGPVGLPVWRAPLPFETREDPVARVPLLGCDEVCELFGFALFEALHRGPEAGRVPLCVRAEPGRESEALRTVRPLELDFAGLLELAGFRSWPLE